MSKIVIIANNLNPIYATEYVTLRVGFIDSNYTLTEVTNDCVYSILYPLDGSVQQDVTKSNLFKTNIPQSVGFKIEYTNGGIVYQEYAYYKFINKLEDKTYLDYAKLFLSELPPTVYTDSDDGFFGAHKNALSKILASIDNEITKTYLNAIPLYATDLNDWNTLFFSNQEINAVHPNHLLQTYYNLRFITTMNKYNASYYISSFIYGLTGASVPVLFDDLDGNQFTYWYLDGTEEHSNLNINTYLSPFSPNLAFSINILNRTIINLSQTQKNIISNFCKKILNPATYIVINYDKSLIDLELFAAGATYPDDIRLADIAAISYIPDQLYKSYLYIGLTPARFYLIDSIEVIPANNTTIEVNSMSEIQVNATLNTGEIINIAQWINFESLDDYSYISFSNIIPVPDNAVAPSYLLTADSDIPTKYNILTAEGDKIYTANSSIPIDPDHTEVVTQFNVKLNGREDLTQLISYKYIIEHG